MEHNRMDDYGWEGFSAGEPMMEPLPPIHADAEREQQIREHIFALIEARLFLDTHPDDKEALNFYRKIERMLKMLKDSETEVPSERWENVELPWPWQKEE